MKNSLVACLLFCFGVSFAQLSVRNDAYVYVNDQVLYVTTDVNIQDSNSRIYLREEGQLLQDPLNASSLNRGEGKLSIYQEGNTNQWEYNYWCSPVGGTLTNTTSNNAFRVNQLEDPLTGTPSTIDSSPSLPTTAYDGSASPLTISTRWLWMFVSSDEYSEWIPADFTTGDIAPGLGFTMKGTGTTANFGDTRYDFRGKPNNGDISNSVALGQFTLIGNPYPSALDARDFLFDSGNFTSITGTLFYWDQDTSTAQRRSHVLQSYVGGYHEFTINSDGSLPTLLPATFFTYDEADNEFPLPGPGEAGIRTASRYIPVGQGFMVEGKINGNVTTKNSHRDYIKEGGSSVFFRNANSTMNPNPSGFQYQENGLVIVPEDYKRFRINVDFTVNENQYTRQMILNFHDSATAGFDYGLELSRSENNASDCYFTLDNKAYSAQAYPFQEELAIPLVVDIEQQQPLRFRIFDIQNFDESQGIYIHDLENDTYVNLRNQDYNLNIAPGHYTDRFEIVFTTESSLAINEFDINSLTINQNNGMHQLSVLNPNSLDITAIEVYDIAGKRLLHGTYDAVSDRYELSTTNLSAGVYVVNVKSQTNAIKSQKVIIKN